MWANLYFLCQKCMPGCKASLSYLAIEIMLSTWTFITFIYCYKWMDQPLLEVRNPVPQQLDLSLHYLKCIKVALKKYFLSIFQSNVKCHWYLSFEFLQLCLLAKYLSFTPQRPCSSYKYFNSQVPLLWVYQHFHSPPLWLTDSHPSVNCCNRNNRQRLPNSEDKAFYLFIWVKWWKMTWVYLLMSINQERCIDP